MDLRRLMSVSLGHLAIDILNSSIAMIITALTVPFDLSNSEIGLGVMAYQLFGSLSQPYFGWLADRFSGRWLGAIGLLWTAIFYMAATFAQSYPVLLILMSCAALGSGAFHPQGALNASAAGRARSSSATGIFFLLGQMGLAFGPIIAGLLIDASGMAGPRILGVLSLPVVALMAVGLHRPLSGEPREPAAERKGNVSPRPHSLSADRRWVALAAFGALVALRATLQQSYYGLLPKFFSDQGFSSAGQGMLVGVFSTALAVGTLVGGVLGDRFSHRKLLIWVSLATTPFAYAMLDAGGAAYLVLAAVAGFLMGIPHSILIVMAQRLLPRRQGLASGAVLGFMFASGAAGTGLFGWLADLTGMAVALHLVALLAVPAAVSAYFLPRRRPAPSAVSRPASSVAD